MPEIKELEEFRTIGTQLLKNLEQQQEEIKKNGEAYQETKNAFKELNDRVDEIEIKLRRAAFDTATSKPAKQEKSLARQAMLKACANLGSLVRNDGSPLLTKDEYDAWTESLQVWRGRDGGMEQKALSIADSTTGGYLTLPPEFIADVIEKVVLISPVRAYANVIQTTRTVYTRPKRTATLSAVWVSEVGTRSENGTGSTLAFGFEEASTHEMFSLVLLSQQMIEDAAFDMDQYIQKQVSQQFAKAEGTAFVVGDANGKPEGILTNANVIANPIHSGSASALAYGTATTGLVGLVHALPSPYAPNARFAMHRLTVGAIRAMVDNNGRPLWMPNFGSFDSANPATILGYPYFEAVDVPQVAGNALSIIFGDFEQGYTIGDRVQMTVQRLVEKYSDTGQIGIQVRKRVAGSVTNDEAFVVQKIAS